MRILMAWAFAHDSAFINMLAVLLVAATIIGFITAFVVMSATLRIVAIVILSVFAVVYLLREYQKENHNDN